MGVLTEIFFFLEVRLGVRDQRIGQLSTRLGIADGDLAQDLDAIGRRSSISSDDTSVSDLCLELSDLPFEEALSFLGSVVLGVSERSPLSRASAI